MHFDLTQCKSRVAWLHFSWSAERDKAVGLFRAVLLLLEAPQVPSRSIEPQSGQCSSDYNPELQTQKEVRTSVLIGGEFLFCFFFYTVKVDYESGCKRGIPACVVLIRGPRVLFKAGNNSEGLFKAARKVCFPQQSQIIEPELSVIHVAHSIREVRVVILNSLIGLQAAACRYLQGLSLIWW